MPINLTGKCGTGRTRTHRDFVQSAPCHLLEKQDFKKNTPVWKDNKWVRYQ